MKKALVIVTTALFLFGGLAWAQMQPGKRGGMMGSDMMGNMMSTMMAGMRGNMMGAGAQDDLPLFHRLVQQR